MATKSSSKERRVARGLDYALVVVCLAIAVWLKNPWWLGAAAFCLVMAVANPGEWLRRRIVSRLFRSAGQR